MCDAYKSTDLPPCCRNFFIGFPFFRAFWHCPSEAGGGYKSNQLIQCGSPLFVSQYGFLHEKLIDPETLYVFRSLFYESQIIGSISSMYRFTQNSLNTTAFYLPFYLSVLTFLLFFTWGPSRCHSFQGSTTTPLQ